MNMSRIIGLLFAVGVIAVHANETNTIVQVANRSFTNATITSDGVFVKVVSDTGIEKFPISRMTTNEQARWNYNPVAAAIQVKQAAVADAALRASLAKQKAASDADNARRGAELAADDAKRKAAAEPAAGWFYGTNRPPILFTTGGYRGVSDTKPPVHIVIDPNQ